MPKQYDRAYFDRWYRDPAQAVASPAEVRRKLAMAVAATEFHLGRPIRNVLDIGCGEGHWRAPLHKLRPQVDYRGLDASPYVVARYGRSRNLGLARFRDLEYLRFEAPFDLMICSNLLHYIGAAEVRRGLSGLDEQLAGLALIEVCTGQDEVEGDAEDYVARTPAWYRRQFKAAGLVAVGSQLYAGSAVQEHMLAMESLAQPGTRTT